jgi:6-pyruvoyltetrahydropterin/6-carboxytetrahydropterin synthase
MSNIRITKNLVSKPVMRCMGMMANVKKNGHSYKLSVTVIRVYREPWQCKVWNGYRFYWLEENCKEEIVDQFDHATVFNETTPHVELAHELKNRGHHVILVDYQPTSENMVIDFAQRIIARFCRYKAFALKLRNRVVFAEWYASDNL